MIWLPAVISDGHAYLFDKRQGKSHTNAQTEHVRLISTASNARGN